MGYKACYLLFYSSNIHSDIWAEIFLKFGIAGLPGWLSGSGKESACQCRRHGFDPRSEKIPHAEEQLSLCASTIEPVL